MTKRKSQAPTGKRTTKKKVELTDATRRQAIEDLEIREPLNMVRVVGARMELHLRSGRVFRWPETPAERKRRLDVPASRKRLAAQPKPKPPPEPPYDSEDRQPEEE